MGKITVLSEELSNRIAAGEVVERPASIVKELLENAIDAGARSIRVELQQGGSGAIRIIDDGEGMEAADVPLAFSRFATSKIRQFDDLYHIRSFGFRGEALPSIAAISRITMLTRRHDRDSGTRLIVDAGKVLEAADCGCPPGTSILVESIFDAVPVRKKFLKSEAMELTACMEVINRVVLPHRDVRIHVQANGRTVLNLPATKEDRERLTLLLGADLSQNLIPLSGTMTAATLTGFASRPDFTRANAKQIFCYVNGRFIRDPLLQHAIMTAYRNMIETKRYPAAVLHLRVPPEEVDINVHPAKMEVRFQKPREMYALIVETLALALSNALPAAADAGSTTAGAFKPARPAYQARLEEALKRYTVASGKSKLVFTAPTHAVRRERETILPPKPDPETPGPAVADRVCFAEGIFLGQVFSTYLVFAHPAGMLLVDQHAAHERVLFERLRLSRAEGPVVTQQLLLPEVISLSPAEFQSALAHQDLWGEVGFTVEPFGGTSIAVKAVPALVPHLDPRQIVMDILGELAELPGTVRLQEQREKLHALLACKGAIKAHQPLTTAEVSALCRDLDAIPFPATCPHGRPTYVIISLKELERMFKRA